MSKEAELVTEPAESTDKDTTTTAEEEFDRLYNRCCDEHGRAVGYLDDDHGPIIFRKPSRAEMKRFTREVSENEADIYLAQEALALSCSYHPKQADMGKLFNLLPCLAADASRELQEIAGPQGRKRLKRRR